MKNIRLRDIFFKDCYIVTNEKKIPRPYILSADVANVQSLCLVIQPVNNSENNEKKCPKKDII